MSLAHDLYMYWTLGVMPGVGVSMGEMMQALDVNDPQQLRSALTRLRKGEVPDPDAPGARLPILSVRYNTADRLYYDLGRLTGDAVERQVPGEIYAEQMAQLLTRAITLNHGIGPRGMVRSADLLANPEIRDLISQFPVEEVYRVEDVVRELGRARHLLALQDGGRPELPDGRDGE